MAALLPCGLAVKMSPAPPFPNFRRGGVRVKPINREAEEFN